MRNYTATTTNAKSCALELIIIQDLMKHYEDISMKNTRYLCLLHNYSIAKMTAYYQILQSTHAGIHIRDILLQKVKLYHN